MKKLLLSFAFFFIAGLALAGSNWYVSASGSGTACTFASPCTLLTAQTGNSGAIGPCDTVYLRAGTYTHTVTTPATDPVFTISASGSGTCPLIWKNYPGERATLDGQAQGSGPGTLNITGSYNWVWGLEFAETGAACDVGRACFDPGPYGNYNFSPPNVFTAANTRGNKFIHCVVHDALNGLSTAGGAGEDGQVDLELYGNVEYGQGYDGSPGTVRPITVTGSPVGYPQPAIVTAANTGGSNCTILPAATLYTDNGAVIKGYTTANGTTCVSAPSCTITLGGGSGALCHWIPFGGSWAVGGNIGNGWTGIGIDNGGSLYLSTHIVPTGTSPGVGAAGQGFTVVSGVITAISSTPPTAGGSSGIGINYCTLASVTAPPCVPVNPTCTLVSGTGSGGGCAATATAGEGSHGHGFYLQNRLGTINVELNISEHNFRYAMQQFSSNGHIDGMTFKRNIFAGGGPSQIAGGSSLIIGGTGGPIYRHMMDTNVVYAANGDATPDLPMGGSTFVSAVFKNNYFVGGMDGARYVLSGDHLPVSSTVTGNSVVGTFSANYADGNFVTTFPSNTYTTSAPGTDQVFLWPSKYQVGRGHLAIFKWAGGSTATVDISSIVPTGYAYEIRNASNYYATPVVSGTCSPCTAVSLPLTQTPYKPVNAIVQPADLGPLFSAFVILAPSLERVAGVQ